MTAENFTEKFGKWAVDDVYTKWHKFALDASIKAYQFAIEQAGAESDARIEFLTEYIEGLVEFHELVTEMKSMDLPVYTPRLDEWK